MIIHVKPGKNKKPVYFYEQEEQGGIAGRIKQVVSVVINALKHIIIIVGTIAALQFTAIAVKILQKLLTF